MNLHKEIRFENDVCDHLMPSPQPVQPPVWFDVKLVHKSTHDRQLAA